MSTSSQPNRWQRLWKATGPGLLFASSAIGTSHLVLSTRAGAHYGMIFFGIILIALVLKYPFYEFGPRYSNATGFSLLKGYRAQGKWAVILFLIVIGINMFAVTGALSAVCAGLFLTVFKLPLSYMALAVGLFVVITTLILFSGGYRGLDLFIKLVSVVLFFTMLTAFIAVIWKGPVAESRPFETGGILKGPGLALLISLLGWMPAGIEASTMNSIWAIERERATNYHPTLNESLFDFKLGYFFTIIVALIFLTIGAFTVYGTGELLEGNATQFSAKLINVFTASIGAWAFPVIAIAALMTIYGTLITIMDAFTRSFIQGLRVLKFKEIAQSEEQREYSNLGYRLLLPILALGGFLLFYLSASSMIKILEGATILSFITAPIIAFLNLRAILGAEIPKSHRPSGALLALAMLGLLGMVSFSIYYLFDLLV